MRPTLLWIEDCTCVAAEKEEVFVGLVAMVKYPAVITRRPVSKWNLCDMFG